MTKETLKNRRNYDAYNVYTTNEIKELKNKLASLKG
jgi:hypothetical protein